jgi:hypothetical protein
VDDIEKRLAELEARVAAIEASRMQIGYGQRYPSEPVNRSGYIPNPFIFKSPSPGDE